METKETEAAAAEEAAPVNESPKPGDRVGCIITSREGVYEMFGFGVYDGMQPCELLPGNMPNPKITLDSGGVVWGCQCWWGSEEKIKKQIGDAKVNTYTPEEWETKSMLDELESLKLVTARALADETLPLQARKEFAAKMVEIASVELK
jgi:hypothetical protein